MDGFLTAIGATRPRLFNTATVGFFFRMASNRAVSSTARLSLLDVSREPGVKKDAWDMAWDMAWVGHNEFTAARSYK
jgi:hypothetical protein